MARPSGLAYSIHTPRLILRCWYPTDATLLQREINENLDYLRPWMDWARQEPETLEMKTERLRRFRDDFLSRRDFVYGIFGADGVRIIGGTGLHTRESKDAREIGYWISRPYANKGLATESTAALTRVAFEVNRVERVEIRCDPRNKPAPGSRRSSASSTVRRSTATRPIRRDTCGIRWCGAWMPRTTRAVARLELPWPPTTAARSGYCSAASPSSRQERGRPALAEGKMPSLPG